MGISQLKPLPPPSLLVISPLFSSMSSSIEYCRSVTSEPYEPTPMPPELTFKEYKVLVNEWAFMEEHYSAAVGAHEEWKVEKAKEAHEKKLRMDQEVRKAKVDALREAAEKKKVLGLA
ncbi:hypothetical protein EV421DRAFT_2042013 [Armillaria borealis]|uniref:Uncharacterized protein n=1 Tax=Armillaria borealis TaxID=47425 RepID=A0AA39MDW3_9AGAR|nr:hypothetical protein EV421DRAFT_2042013 [Armillaria borealis]